MDTKHYGAGYLQDTGDFLKQLKMHSYSPFETIIEGVVADLGCGTGIDAVNLANRLGSAVQVVGVDHDATLIDHAKSASKGISNVSFIRGEVYQLDFKDESVSGVRMERLVQHLTAPQDMFREVYRVLRKGQPLVIVETIWNSLTFYTQHVAIEAKICHYLTAEKVNNGWAGNKLTTDLLANGFQEVQLQTFNMVTRSREEASRYLFLDKILLEMFEKGKLSQAEYDNFQLALNQLDESGCFLVSMNLVIAQAKK
ncbi:methyltransferase domain-containing protein [Sphingobacterium sp. N143]|uniref:methyltransferase domain-containing protein n=1 Tax=Sphingobacterium sp. N143 TaxID=2746727 RepID=UPI0025789247|nr:methyltransferase domain-containing protein [Sphingobacterium sp. N143]MDM1296119.1 methyltransferase domain-containing protein [Sphingobacterium sp. N143]